MGVEALLRPSPEIMSKFTAFVFVFNGAYFVLYGVTGRNSLLR